MKTARLFVLVAALIGLLMLAGCGAIPRPGGGGDAPTDENGPPESTREVRGPNVDTVFAVNVTPAIQGEIRDYIEVNGDVRTTTSIDVYANTAGEVVRLYTSVGRTVQAEQLIAEIDPSRPGQNFALSPVTAPIAGTITRLPVRVGSQVTLAAPIAEVSRTTELEIVVQIAERFISKVRTGLPATVHLDAFPGEVFDATVTELNPVVDPTTRTLEVTLRFDRADRRVRSGMYAAVRIITEQKENIVKVPADVLVRRFGETFVFVVRDNGTAERRDVTPGIEIDNVLEITAGLEPGEAVVYQGQALLAEGAQVRVINRISPLEDGDNP